MTVISYLQCVKPGITIECSLFMPRRSRFLGGPRSIDMQALVLGGGGFKLQQTHVPGGPLHSLCHLIQAGHRFVDSYFWRVSCFFRCAFEGATVFRCQAQTNLHPPPPPRRKKKKDPWTPKTLFLFIFFFFFLEKKNL